MKTITAIIERCPDGSSSIYMGNADFLDYGITCTGKTEAEAIATFYELYEGMRELYKEENKHFEEVDFTFQKDVVSYLQFYAKCFTLVSLGRITGVSKSQLSHYINRSSNPKKKTADKILNAIQNFFVQEAKSVSA